MHGKDRNDALIKLNRALEETKVYGCVTNIGYLKSIVSSHMFREFKLSTSILNTYHYDEVAIEVITPGSHTSMQGYPGRTGYWRVGVPPSGPMDSYSFRLANRIVGDAQNEPAIEITLTGPTILFHTNTTIGIAGGSCNPKLNGDLIEQFKPVIVSPGDTLTIDKITSGCRAYLAIKGSIDVPEYLGPSSTFTLGQFGGHNGRVLKTGDTFFLESAVSELTPKSVPKSLVPIISSSKY